MSISPFLRIFTFSFAAFFLICAGDPDYAAKKKASDDFRNNFVATEIPSADDLHWTGSIDKCLPGKVSRDVCEKMLKRINYFRRLAGVHDDVFLDSSWNKYAQAAALVMMANGELTHDITPDMKCYSKDAKIGAATSNLSTIVDASIQLLVADEMQDGGMENKDCGHRRWILYSHILKMGIGITPASYSIRTFTSEDDDPIDTSCYRGSRPAYFGYPFKGFIPYEVVYPKWSFSVPGGADFRSATVSVTAGAKQLNCTVISRVSPDYGDPSLIWMMQGLKKDFDYNYYNMNAKHDAFVQLNLLNQKINVKIDHVKIDGNEKSFQYSFTIIDPDDYK